MDADLHQYRLSQIGSPASTLAALAEINTGSLSKHFNDTQRLPTDALRRITTALTDLELVKTVTAPLPIDWSDVKALREIIAGLKDKTLSVTVTKSAPQIRPKGYSVRFRDGHWLAGRKRTGEPIASLTFIGSCAMTADVADRLLEILAAMGYSGCSKVEQSFSSFVEADIEKIWASATKCSTGNAGKKEI